MKKTTLAATSFAVLLSPLAGNAMDWTPDVSRNLSDVFYMPKAGQFYSKTDYSYATTKYDVVANIPTAAAKLYGLKDTNSSLAETITLGLMDNLAVDLGIEYVFKNNRNYDGGYTNVFSSAGYKNDGWENPVLGITYRALEHADSGMILDLRASYSHDLANAESSDDYYYYMADTTWVIGSNGDRRGSVASGNDVTTLGLKTGQRFKDMSWSVFGDVIFGTRSGVKTISTNGDIEIAPTTDYKIGFDSQLRFSDMVSLNTGLSKLFTETRSVYYHNTGDYAEEYKDGDEVDLDLSLNFAVVPEMLTLSATYQYKWIDQVSIINPGSADYISYDDGNAQTYGLTAHAQF